MMAEAVSFRGRRIGGFGLGALAVLQPCDQVTFQVGGGVNRPVLPAGLVILSSFFGGGTWSYAAVNGGSGPLTMPTSFADIGGAALPWTLLGAPVVHPSPPNMHWNGSACVPNPSVLPIGSCPPGTAGEVLNGRWVCKPVYIAHTAPAPGGSSGAGIFTLQQGHRVQVSITASGGAALPSDYQGQTTATMQAALAASGLGTIQVVSVGYPSASTLVVVVDHCSASRNVPSPLTVQSAGVSVVSTYQDMGVSPVGACGAAAAPSTGMSTGAIVGIVAAVLAAGGAAFALSR